MRYNYSEFQVYVPNKGFKLVSELSMKEAKDSLCETIDLVSAMADKAEESLALVRLKKEEKEIINEDR